jgi:pimeloyl-ACP methyl ester carboxylesterase
VSTTCLQQDTRAFVLLWVSTYFNGCKTVVVSLIKTTFGFNRCRETSDIMASPTTTTMKIAGGAEVNLTVERVGDFRVSIQEKVTGNPKIGALVTIHDIGLNRQCYMDFLNKEYNVQLFEKFVIYHIEVPGQHADAEQFSPDYEFLALPKMADRMIAVLERYHLKDCIGLGVGAGAVLLIHLAMAAPEKFLGITVIDPAGKSLGFKEWGEQKLAAWQLEKKGFTSGVEKFLMWHLFGTKASKGISMDMLDQVVKDITAKQNPHNLSQYVKAFMSRTDFMNEIGDKLKCSVLIITSNHSPYKDKRIRCTANLIKRSPRFWNPTIRSTRSSKIQKNAERVCCC